MGKHNGKARSSGMTGEGSDQDTLQLLRSARLSASASDLVVVADSFPCRNFPCVFLVAVGTALTKKFGKPKRGGKGPATESSHQLHTTLIHDERPNIQSVLEANDLEAFMELAQVPMKASVCAATTNKGTALPHCCLAVPPLRVVTRHDFTCTQLSNRDFTGEHQNSGDFNMRAPCVTLRCVGRYGE